MNVERLLALKINVNIFYLDKDPVKAAKIQYNKHVVKMPLESAQMLCTAHHAVLGDDAIVPYKVAHLNHPSSIWARTSRANYMWLYNHFKALASEYTTRYGRIHLSWTKCHDILSSPPRGIPDIGLTEMPQCMPDEYKTDCSIQAYWNYYIGEKHSVANPNKELIYDRRP